eukprot:UN14615
MPTAMQKPDFREKAVQFTGKQYPNERPEQPTQNKNEDVIHRSYSAVVSGKSKNCPRKLR